MSAKNTLANKAKRRAEREENAARQVRRRIARARMQYLAAAPPQTFEELEASIAEIAEEAE